ncbi:hypothetical protein DENSPDRAFT_788877 [Dentipellis sp. KUC8613]|nr:hypothetical protein DENSPDRAFT_788877 [Dentipellis sp. KUC8613]
MFEIIKGVFNRNSEFLEGDHSMIEKARKLMVQMVNALTVKQETGGPLASLYLLGNPDHYTNFSFKVFFWNSYVNEVIIGKVKGNMVAISPILDYTLRPKKYEDMTLYDWIRTAEKYKIPKKRTSTCSRRMKAEDLDLRSEASFGDRDKENDKMEIDPHEDEDEDLSSDSDSDSEDDDDNSKANQMQKRRIHPQFLQDHPHHDTHSVRIHPESKAKIPSFIGTLPRPDQGNYDDYCVTMLTLFKPWRSGYDLKLEGEKWEQSFQRHTFTNGQKEIMKFMNIRHECYDARDDFRAQRIKAGTAKGLSFIGGQFWSELDKENMMEEEIYRAGMDHLDNAFDENNISNANLKKAIEMAQIESVVGAAGWLESSAASQMSLDHEWTTGQERNAAEWKNLLATKRAEVLTQKQYSTNNSQSNEDSDNEYDDPPNDVVPIYKSYLTNEFKADSKEDQKLINSYVKKFTLNEEQERAFRIIANHSCCKVKDQLVRSGPASGRV